MILYWYISYVNNYYMIIIDIYNYIHDTISRLIKAPSTSQKTTLPLFSSFLQGSFETRDWVPVEPWGSPSDDPLTDRWMVNVLIFVTLNGGVCENFRACFIPVKNTRVTSVAERFFWSSFQHSCQAVEQLGCFNPNGLDYDFPGLNTSSK